jgi:hypothetical protein
MAEIDTALLVKVPGPIGDTKTETEAKKKREPYL